MVKSINGPLTVLICISGGGTTMVAVIQAIMNGLLRHVRVGLIISSRREAGGLLRARELGIPENDIHVISFRNQAKCGEKILRLCEERDIDVIFQCGLLRKMPKTVVVEYRGKIFNQHPGPLDGDYLGFGGDGMYGIAVHAAVLHFARLIRHRRPFSTEATVHRVTEEFDKGALIAIQPVQILRRDTPYKLAKRVLRKEHELVINTFYRLSESWKIEESDTPAKGGGLMSGVVSKTIARLDG